MTPFEFKKMNKRVETEEEAYVIQRPYREHWMNVPHSEKSCCASVHNGAGSVGFHQCSKKPKYWYGRLGYCAVHDPNAVLERERARNEKWAAESKARHERWERNARIAAYEKKCAETIRKIAEGHNDPRGLCVDLMNEFPDVSNVMEDED